MRVFGDGVLQPRFFYPGFWRRRSPIILGFLAATLLTALIAGTVFPRGYVSSSLLSIRDLRTPSYNYYFAQANVHYARTFSRIISTPGFLARAVREAGVDRSHAAVRKAVSVTAIADTELIEVNVRDRDPVVAWRLNKSIIDVLAKEWTKEIRTAVAPEIPEAPVERNTLLNVSLAVLVALLTAAGALGFIEYSDNSLKATDQLRSLGYGEPVVLEDPYLAGSLLDGGDDAAPSWAASLESEPFYRLRNRLLDGEGKVVLACELADGVEAPFVTAGIAIFLAQAGLKTLVVDADFERARLSFLLDGTSLEGLSEFLCAASVSDAKPRISAMNIPNLGLLSAGRSREGAVAALTTDVAGRALGLLEPDWDVILVGGLSLARESRLEAFLPAAKEVVVIARLFQDGVDAAHRLRDVVGDPRVSAVVI